MPEQTARELRDPAQVSGPFRASHPVAPPQAAQPVQKDLPSKRQDLPSKRPVALPRLSQRPIPVPRFYLTGRGALVAMFALFFLGCLLGGWLSLVILTALCYATGCVLAPFCVRRRALLQVAVAPPAVFMAAVILTQVLTAQGSSRHGLVLSVLEGTALTLAATAPWLLAATAACVGVAFWQGLGQCFRELQAELRGERGPGPGGQAKVS
jgi:hypothetical protein